MKILLVSHFFPPTHNAGTENYTLGMAKTLQARGHEVCVLCAEDWETGDKYWNGITEEEYQGVLVRRIHLNWIMANNPNQVLYISDQVSAWMAHFLQDEKFDIVHVLSTYSLGVGIFESIKRAGVPLILTLMDFWFLCPSVQLLRSTGELCDGLTTPYQCQSCLMLESGASKKMNKLGLSTQMQSRLWEPLANIPILAKQPGFRGKLLDMKERKKLLKRVIDLPDLVLSHSAIVKEIFSRHTPREIRILPNGHDLSWVQAEAKKKAANQLLRIGYMGQVVPIKGVHILVEAFQKANLLNRATLEIWGGLEQDLDYVNDLKRLIEGNPAISLNGRFSRDDLTNVLSRFDILVVPSLWLENAPLVIQEAFALKIPVIATNLGGMAEMISHEVNGLLFGRGDALDLASQLQRLLDEPGLLGILSSRIPKVKSIDEEMKQLEALYSELLSVGKIIN